MAGLNIWKNDEAFKASISAVARLGECRLAAFSFWRRCGKISYLLGANRRRGNLGGDIYARRKLWRGALHINAARSSSDASLAKAPLSSLRRMAGDIQLCRA